MILSRKEVDHIAELARLELDQSELELYRKQLSAILDYAARLLELDTTDISPTSSVLPLRSVLRSDKTKLGLPLEELLLNAPLTEREQFRVPPVLE